MPVIKDDDSQVIAESVKPDSKNRIVLPKNVIKDGVTYRIYINKHDQIILDPQMTIPLSEMWLFENKDILDSMDKGMAESMNGQTADLGSFAQYLDDES